MIGHEPLIAMRRNGSSPVIVFVNDFDCQTAKDWHNPGGKYGELWPIDHPTVSTSGDDLKTIDLRFLVGLTVVIASETEDRAKALFDRAKQCGAKTVV